jgi:hypothetical protein
MLHLPLEELQPPHLTMMAVVVPQPRPMKFLRSKVPKHSLMMMMV